MGVVRGVHDLLTVPSVLAEARKAPRKALLPLAPQVIGAAVLEWAAGCV